MEFSHVLLSRRNFVAVSATGGAGMLFASELSQGAQGSAGGGAKEPLKPEMVKEFVIAAHLNFDRVKEMLAQEPTLLNACWDWGNGDFELAIGGAGHMGRRDIALYLLEKGARMDLFVAAMLGHLEIVKATLEAFPNLLYSKGPHGIPLLVHAQKGGSEAKAVLDYLQSLKKV